MTCENCRTEENVRQFYPPDGQDHDKHYVYFCENCFFSGYIDCDEPITEDERIQMWRDAKTVSEEKQQ